MTFSFSNAGNTTVAEGLSFVAGILRLLDVQDPKYLEVQLQNG
jgi:hypothetical protein